MKLYDKLQSSVVGWSTVARKSMFFGFSHSTDGQIANQKWCDRAFFYFFCHFHLYTSRGIEGEQYFKQPRVFMLAKFLTLMIVEFYIKIYVFYTLEREILLLLPTFYYYFHRFHSYHKRKNHYSTLEPLARKIQPKTTYIYI